MTWLKEYRDINSFLSVVEMAGHFVILFGLIVVVSSDLGSASILLLIFLSMFFALGVRLYWFALGGAAVAAAVPLLWTYFLKDYQKKRLIAPYDPSIDPDGWGITWQTTQSKLGGLPAWMQSIALRFSPGSIQTSSSPVSARSSA